MPVKATRDTLPPRPKPRFDADTYLTDGVRLLRTVSAATIEAGVGLAEVEDCATLDVVLLSHQELVVRGFRPVRLAPERRPTAGDNGAPAATGL